MNKILTVLLSLVLLQLYSFGQTTYPVIGINDERPEVYLFKNATIVVDYQTKLENADLLIKKGKIEDVGENLRIPEGAVIVDLEGKYIYPSLIDIYTNYGLPRASVSTGSFMMYGSTPEQFETKTKGAYNWNEAIKSYYNAIENFSRDEKTAAEYRKLGFGAVLTFNADGIARGSSSLVTLSDEKENDLIIKGKASAHYSFNKGTSRQNYPSSQMGYIALLRQTYIDAEWYSFQNTENIYDESLESWISLQDLPQIFEVRDKLSLIRADRIGDEFSTQYIITGSGEEYQRIKEIKATNAPLIVPINFPKAMDVKDPYDELMIPLERLKHWELAPTNLARLEENEITFAITATGLSNKADFWKNLKKAISYGLDESTALKALTYVPAKLLKVENEVGSLKKGMLANFLITSGNLFDEKVILYENWIQGKKFVLKNIDLKDYSGLYEFQVEENKYEVEISGTIEKPVLKVVINDTTKITTKSVINKNLITINYNPDQKNKEAGNIRLSGWITDKSMKGTGQMPDGTWISWNAKFKNELEEDKKKEESKKIDAKKEIGKVIYPFMAYGMEELPVAEDVLFKNATVWTNEEEGILENTDVLVQDGKIVQIGQGLKANAAIEIDGTGKHLTCGIIDEHSHIALSGTNEGSHAITSEVRMGDVVNSEDISIYRQLAGGTTAAQILHGSANPIGGQSQLIKHRWGRSSEELKIKNTVGFLKHALGENVKQSRSPAWISIRYPQSRMGVEQIIKDSYIMARDYKRKWDEYNNLSDKEKAKAEKPRKDLRLEGIVDVLEEKSFITCHAYVQSETNMIMKLAEEFGIKAHTLIHNSEGYKIADLMKEHGAMGSLLPDWWAYKWEVYDAIPYNAALNLGMGLVTCIHSDNAELARRLNQEAAKAVKYGNVSEEEAWKLVTLNPAKILHLDDRMGSIKTGKDADLVLWNDNPLSIYAIVETTMVDGIIYYDLKKNEKLMEANSNERSRLIKKLLEETPSSPASGMSGLRR